MPKGSARCRANQAYTALHHGEGVWCFGKDAEIERPKALQDANPTKRSYRDREFALSYKKTDFFYKLKAVTKCMFRRSFFCCFFCYRIAQSDTEIPPLPTAKHTLVTFYKNFSSFSVHKNKKILKNTGKVESNLL